MHGLEAFNGGLVHFNRLLLLVNDLLLIRHLILQLSNQVVLLSFLALEIILGLGYLHAEFVALLLNLLEFLHLLLIDSVGLGKGRLQLNDLILPRRYHLLVPTLLLLHSLVQGVNKLLLLADFFSLASKELLLFIQLLQLSCVQERPLNWAGLGVYENFWLYCLGLRGSIVH